MRKHYITLLALVVTLVIMMFVLPIGELRSMVVIALFCLTLIGQVIFLGYTGQILLCQATFMAIGGYGSATLTLRYGYPPIGGILLSTLASIIFAFLVGKVVLRLKTYYLAIATLAIALMTDALMGGWVDVTGGYSGLRGVPPIAIGGLVFDNVRLFYILVWVIAMVGWIFAFHLRTSRFGRALRTLNGDELVASSMGIDVPRFKVQALMVTAAYAALSGALQVHFMGIVLPNFFNIEMSFKIVMAAILGGAGNVYGVFLAAPLLRYFPEVMDWAGDYKLIIYGLLFIIIPMYFMGGITGIVNKIMGRFRNILSKESRSDEITER